MNWLMWAKIFSCFYNKCRPVNCMHYIKCAVSSSLLTLLWLLQKGCGTLDPCFIKTHSIHKECVLQIYFDVIFHKNKATRTGPHHIGRIYTLCPFFGCGKHTDGSAFVLMILLASVCYGDCWVAKHILHPHLVLQPIWGWADLGSFQLPHSTSSPEFAWNICRYI